MRHGRIDLEEVRRAASGRWDEIVPALTGIDPAILDARHHPCPRCPTGGHDRFRAFDDFSDSGGVICNQCFQRKNGDGFSTIQWANGIGFGEALRLVADYLGVKPASNSSPRRLGDDLEFIDWNPAIAHLWCIENPPITVAALELVGARLATYRYGSTRHQVIAIPSHGQNGKACGWTIYNATGGLLPARDGPIKSKVTCGSKPGIIGDQGGRIVWKTEGPKDLLSLLSLGLPEEHSAFANAHGTIETPHPWMVSQLEGKSVAVVHDADDPGQAGAKKWCEAIARVAAECRHVILPYSIELKHGKDLRDWINEGNGYSDLVALAKVSEVVQEKEPDAPPEPIEAADDPDRLAKINLDRYRNEFGRELRYWNQMWFSWKNGRYVEVTEDHLISRIGSSIKLEFNRLWEEEFAEYQKWKTSGDYDPDRDKGPPKVRKVTTSLIRNVYQQTKSQRIMKSRQKMEAWIDQDREGWFVAVRNGILDLQRLLKNEHDDILIPHTPDWFSTICLPYEFDPTADCPVWKSFLIDVFNGDDQTIDALQKWFGYLLTPDKSLHKILFIIGQTRSGKGTIMRVMRALLGVSNVATPTLTELAGPFGLQSLVSKTVAVIPDARISNRVDETAVTERLLSISGDDPQNIQRKFLSTLVGHDLKVRFTLFSNLLPKLRDTSSAFVSRCIFLSMPNSYFGREDPTIHDRLMSELSGIMNWAIYGRLMLNESKRIDQPQSGVGLLNEMKSIISPVMQFIEERCEVGPQHECSTREMFAEWEDWCEENDVSLAGSIQSFSRKLKAVNPSIDTMKRRFGANTTRSFVGIKVKIDAVDF